MYYKRYAIGDKNDDESRFLPFSDENADYDFGNHFYTPTESYIKKRLGIDISLDYKYPDQYREDVRDQILEIINNNPNPYASEIVEFKIARTRIGRQGFLEAYIAQVRYTDRTGKDMNEQDDMISPRAITILKSARYGYLLSLAPYSYRVNPDVTDDDGYRNGY